MKKNYLFLTFIFICALQSKAQNIKDSSILLSAICNTQSNTIKISWTTTDASGYQISRKTTETDNWGTPLATISSANSFYIDSTAKKGMVYEYRVAKIKGNSIRAVGYIASGIEVALNHYRKNILILVDSSTYNSIDSNAWKTLKNDYYLDGYGVTLMLVSEYSKPPAIKSKIAAWSNPNRGLNKQCLFIGRVPVAYSGTMLANTTDLPPDAHPDHGGAWPTDLYYAELDGAWTDFLTMTTNVTRAANINNPGDGKFDPHFIPDNIDIQIGRIDFRMLPAQGKSDIKMVENYLRKLHQFKSGAVQVPNKAFISDNFTYLGGEMPMRSGWNNASCIVGQNNITSTGNYFDSCKANSYLYANVMGGGSFTNCSGVGASNQFTDSIRAVFNVMFGSYFGDWNTQDNFLRSCLASKGLTLTNVWAHRPHWYFHQMAMGMQIGHSVVIAQNNQTDFSLNYGYIGSFSGNYLDRRISMNLMGDPTLRVHYFDGAKNLSSNKINSNKNVVLTWTASTEPGVIGYHVYRTSRNGGVYYPITSTPINALTFTDMNPYNGNNYYIVKAIKLESSNTGTYYNSSLGVMTIATGVLGTNTDIEENKIFKLSVYPNPAQSDLTIETEANSTVKIYDLNGRVVFETQTKNVLTQVNTSTWAKGIYLVNCNNGSASKTEKLIIQ
jgi:hypothetical protein